MGAFGGNLSGLAAACACLCILVLFGISLSRLKIPKALQVALGSATFIIGFYQMAASLIERERLVRQDRIPLKIHQTGEHEIRIDYGCRKSLEGLIQVTGPSSEATMQEMQRCVAWRYREADKLEWREFADSPVCKDSAKSEVLLFRARDKLTDEPITITYSVASDVSRPADEAYLVLKTGESELEHMHVMSFPLRLSASIIALVAGAGVLVWRWRAGAGGATEAQRGKRTRNDG